MAPKRRHAHEAALPRMRRQRTGTRSLAQLHTTAAIMADAAAGAASQPLVPHVGSAVPRVNPKRARLLTSTQVGDGDGRARTGVVYWMSRDQRSADNWALLYAQSLAMSSNVPLYVVFCLQDTFLDAPYRHFGFMVKGLKEVETQLRARNIPFHLLRGPPPDQIPQFCQQCAIDIVVADFSPLRIALQWKKALVTALDALRIAMVEVDAHNIVPCWIASDKLEVGARTMRLKLNAKLAEFLTDFPPLQVQTHPAVRLPPPFDLQATLDSLVRLDRSIPEVAWCQPGETHAQQWLADFIRNRLAKFHTHRNNPTVDATSHLSPWLHFGQLAPQRCALAVRGLPVRLSASVASFLEEVIVRRELAENFCYYQPRYDEFECAPAWAKETLRQHESDPRPVIYTLQCLESATTVDDLWNAAQLQMMRDGTMHGYLRMYWAKKILEWTPTVAEAYRIALYLNDKYELDGRDPNGYAGCAWSILGVHDTAWPTRPIFGKLRFMNYEGCKRKFAVTDFVARFPLATINARIAREEAGGPQCVVDHRHFTMRRKRKLPPTVVIHKVHEGALEKAHDFIRSGALGIIDTQTAIDQFMPPLPALDAPGAAQWTTDRAAAAAAEATDQLPAFAAEADDETEEQAAKRLHLVFP